VSCFLRVGSSIFNETGEAVLGYLETQDGFIQLSQEDYNPGFENWVTLPNGVKLRLLDSGVLEVSPAKNSNEVYVLSCGVHGNETAPIEIISHQISKIVTGSIEPKHNLLYILGNPGSMKIADRFVSINMNRLFAGAFKKSLKRLVMKLSGLKRLSNT